jgi:hypothetical protein
MDAPVTEISGIHIPGNIQSHILEHMSYSETQRLWQTSPVFLHAALRARYNTVNLDFTRSDEALSSIDLIRRLR